MAAKTCVMCGAGFTAGRGEERGATAITCSTTCGKARDREKSRERAKGYRANDPDYTRRIVQWRRERMRTDPAFRRQEQKRASRRKMERYRTDPAFRARVLARLREQNRRKRKGGAGGPGGTNHAPTARAGATPDPLAATLPTP